ncbi:MAG: AbrB/MazE/SpoVT family DNA-binding domain-containing protein [Patescibacteria group bacterium]
MNRKQKEKNVRKIFRQGKTSLAVTLPVELVAELKWKEKQRVLVKRKGSKLIISDWKR